MLDVYADGTTSLYVKSGVLNGTLVPSTNTDLPRAGKS